jgi:hypothetical protein
MTKIKSHLMTEYNSNNRQQIIEQKCANSNLSDCLKNSQQLTGVCQNVGFCGLLNICTFF